MADIEIPLESERGKRYRFFEILPGALSWFMLALPVGLSFVNIPLGGQVVNLGVVFVLLLLLINFTRGMAGGIRAIQGYNTMRAHQALPWTQMLQEIETVHLDPRAKRPRWHHIAVDLAANNKRLMPPSEVVHAIIIATYKEVREVLQPTIESVLASEYDMKKVILILAYEERGGAETEELAKSLMAEYKDKFMDTMAVKHPRDIPNEVVGKGGNVTYAGRELERYLAKHKIDPLRVLVTTLDADNRPDKNYLNALSYVYVLCPDPVHTSFQPVSLYTNNIWDAPAPMRVLATGNSIFNLVVSLRGHALRNFSSHAQPMVALMQTDYWSVRTIVEDGHQFWRSYFAFGGNYRVLPLHVPISQDAVLTDSYRKTLKAQFIQLRRWTYGASDVAYLADQGFFKANKVPKLDLIAKFWRLLEGHVTWAVGPILVLTAGFIPVFFNHKSQSANLLPLIVSRIQTVALIAAFATLFLALKTLPPKPARYKRHRTLWMVLQWLYLPLTTIVYNSFAALYSQTRLMFGRYMSKFDVTEKAVMVDRAGKASKLKS
jgi:cellulose synthase/poly-beta-1,6-N-acetylglucosamine synthase-like glycosyltransferase